MGQTLKCLNDPDGYRDMAKVSTTKRMCSLRFDLEAFEQSYLGAQNERFKARQGRTQNDYQTCQSGF